MSLSIDLTLPPHRDVWVAEIWHDYQQLAEIYRQGDAFEIEFYNRPKSPVQFPLLEFLNAVSEARTLLVRKLEREAEQLNRGLP